jgi:transposase
MVQETLAPGASVAIIARRHGVNANQLFSWRRQYRRGVLELVNAPVSAESALVPITVAPIEAPHEEHSSAASESHNGGRIDIEFTGGRRVSVWGRADLETLCTILREFSRP